MRIHREGTNILILLFAVLIAINVPVWLFKIGRASGRERVYVLV